MIDWHNPIVAYELVALPGLVLFALLFRRAGLKPWAAMLVLLPLVGFAAAGSALAFPRWPALPPKPPRKILPVRGF